MAKTSRQIVERYVVSSARLGNRAAKAQLVELYQTRFLRHAYRLLGDPEQAKDAVQDGWLEIMRGLYRLKDDEAFPAWAFRIITRCCTRLIKRQIKARHMRERLFDEQVLEIDQDSFELAAEEAPLRKALEALSAEHRATVALFYLEEMSVAEVAVALDIPVGTVKSRLLHARGKLRASLTGENDGQVGRNDPGNA